jgi:hypothetical protein
MTLRKLFGKSKTDTFEVDDNIISLAQTQVCQGTASIPEISLEILCVSKSITRCHELAKKSTSHDAITLCRFRGVRMA